MLDPEVWKGLDKDTRELLRLHGKAKRQRYRRRRAAERRRAEGQRGSAAATTGDGYHDADNSESMHFPPVRRRRDDARQYGEVSRSEAKDGEFICRRDSPAGAVMDTEEVVDYDP